MLSFLHVGTSLRCPTKIARLGASEGPMGYALRLARADAAVPGAGRAQCLAAGGGGGAGSFLKSLVVSVNCWFTCFARLSFGMSIFLIVMYSFLYNKKVLWVRVVYFFVWFVIAYSLNVFQPRRGLGCCCCTEILY